MCEYGLGLGDWLKRGVVVPLGGCTHVRVRSVPHRPSFPSELFASDGNGMKQRKHSVVIPFTTTPSRNQNACSCAHRRHRLNGQGL